MTEREIKKIEQIKKIEKRLAKWEGLRNEKGFAKTYQWAIDELGIEVTYERFYERYLKDVDYEIKHAKEDLANANATLEKIRQGEAKKRVTEQTLEEMPTAIKEFKDKVINDWNTYDTNLRAKIMEEYRNAETRDERRELVRKYGTQMELRHKSLEEINKQNTKDAENLVLNLYKRVIDITGDITDAKGLFVTAGNNGYAVINGLVIGKEGMARVDSIEAGGYNIQRWHIRTLVKAC